MHILYRDYTDPTGFMYLEHLVGKSMTQASSNRAHVHFATVGIEIAIHRYDGNGPEVLLIHGIGSSSADFNPVIHQMTAFCQPITIDLRGHGASGQPASGYHYQDYIRDLDIVLTDLQMEHPIILGHSLGGIITLMWAAMNPSRPHALIIEDSPLRSGGDFREAFDGWLMLNALPQAAARDWYETKNPDWSADLLDQRSFDMVNTARAAIEELREISLSNNGLDSFAGLEAITAPLLFLQGDPDAGSMVIPEDLEAMQQLLPQMEVEQFPGAGHTIHRSHPEEWLERVQAFIESVKN